MRGARRTRRQQVIAALVATALGVPALLGIATAIGLLLTRPIDDLPGRVDAILVEHHASRVPLAQVPDQLSEALIAIEDERFYQHRGIDTQGVIRAVLTDLYRHRALQGGSTLSQQLVKVVYLNDNDDGARKLEDILLTLKVEARFDKHTILENYFNVVYYGHGAYGVGAASRIYFHQPPPDLDLARAAMLAGLPQSPSVYDPYINPCGARARQFSVLAQMAHDGYISQDEASRAYSEPIGFPCK
jgi:membrane peptidoglycan carboxypeptidase